MENNYNLGKKCALLVAGLGLVVSTGCASMANSPTVNKIANSSFFEGMRMNYENVQKAPSPNYGFGSSESIFWDLARGLFVSSAR